jgi:4-amino-4-deoxy-L-arabinose transferase-like glycosyltransferase
LEIIGLLSLFYFPSARSLFPIRDLAYHAPASPLLEIWARWDSEWYLLVTEKGYDSYEYFKDAGGGRYLQTDAAKFFPLYPWIVRLITLITGNTILSAVLVSNLAAVLFLYYFYRLSAKLFNSESAAQASLFYIFFPTSFFLNAIYAESLFLACLLAAFYYLEQRKLFPAMIASALALLARPFGIFAVPVLLWLSALRFPERKYISILLLAISCMAGFLLYAFVIWKTFGSFSPITDGTNYWRGQTHYPFYAFVRFFKNPVALHGQHNSIIDFSFALLHLLAAVFSFRRLPFPYVLYSIICIVFPLSSSLFSFSRLCLVNFPFFLYLGSQLSGRWAFTVQLIFAMLLAFFMTAFANWYWVG